MNSRAAYDEDEVLKKVLEESKHDGVPAEENGNRKKRSREDSEESVCHVSHSLWFTNMFVAVSILR